MLNRSYSMRTIATLSVLVAALLVATACGDEPPTFDRKSMLEDTATAFEQEHDALVTRKDALSDAVSSFCGQPNEQNLESARTAWTELRTSMRRIEAWSYNGSPYRNTDMERPLYKRDKPPATGENIDAVIAGGDARYQQDLRQDGDDMPDRVFPSGDDTIDDAFVADQNYLRRAKGLPAVEYLLYDAGAGESTPSSVVSQYTSADGADRRCSYLEAVNGDLGQAVQAYRDAWSPSGGDFVETFQSETEGSQMWPTVQSSIDAMVSHMVFASRMLMKKQRIGGPLGEHPMDGAVPQRVEAPYSQTSKQSLLRTLSGIELIYNHDQGTTLRDFTEFRQQRVADLVGQRLTEARQAIEAIPAPLSDAVESNTEQVQTARTELEDLARAVETELAVTIGATASSVVVDTD